MFSAGAIVIRAAFGLLLAMFLAVGGFYAGWFSSPPGALLPVTFLIWGSGLGAAVGGFIGWFKPEVPRTVNAVHLALALIGGLAGAWVGWELGLLLYSEGLQRPGDTSRSPPFRGGGGGGRHWRKFAYVGLLPAPDVAASGSMTRGCWND